MSERRTFASVTDIDCTCGYLERAADDPIIPIMFDSLTDEYHFKHGESSLVIYHCPFCGGAAPESKRALLFAIITPEEEYRLAQLLAPLQSIADALAQLGSPERDEAGGTMVTRAEADGHPPAWEQFRTLVYEKLSELADVHIVERRDGSVHWSLTGKYIGKPQPESGPAS